MARGAEAKQNWVERARIAFGADYVGVDDTGKKWYFWSKEGGERIQVCVTLTVPKTPLECEGNGGDLNFGDEPSPVTVSKPVEMGEDEAATFERLRKELGL